jgi:hypothetical protein
VNAGVHEGRIRKGGRGQNMKMSCLTPRAPRESRATLILLSSDRLV